MPKSVKSRASGDTIRINLSGIVADGVVEAAARLGISYSAYVQLRLQGQLGRMADSRTDSVQSAPTQPITVLSELPKVIQAEPKRLITDLSQLPAV